MGSLRLRNCRFLVTHVDGELVVLENVDVVVENGLITHVGRGQVGGGGFETIDCGGLVAMPGLANAHTHLHLTALRGIYEGLGHGELVARLLEIEGKLTRDLASMSIELGVIEVLMGGTTSFIDTGPFPEVVAEVAARYGLRAMVGPAFNNKLLDPKQVEGALRRLLGTLGDKPMIRPVIGINGPLSHGPEALEEARRLLRELGLRVQIHLARSRDEVYLIKAKTGKLPVEYLDSLGLLGRGTHLVGLGWATSWELNRIAESGAGVVHLPTVDMKLATGGFLPLKELMGRGLVVALGTCMAPGGWGLCVLNEARLAILLQRHTTWDTSFGAEHALKAATLNGYRLMETPGGSLWPGHVADIVLLRTKAPHLQPLRRDNLVEAIIYGAPCIGIEKVIVGGSVVYDREVMGEELGSRALELGERINEELITKLA